MSNILYFPKFSDSTKHNFLDSTLDSCIDDIVIDGLVIQSKSKRKSFIELFVQKPYEMNKIYEIETKIQRLGNYLGFKEKGSYDELYLLLDQDSDFYHLGDRKFFIQTISNMLDQNFSDEHNFNVLTHSLVYYSIKSTLFEDQSDQPRYSQMIIASHRRDDRVSKEINDEFINMNNQKLFKEIKDYIEYGYRSLPSNLR